MTTASRVVEGLKTNTAYTFKVRAKNSLGIWGAFSAAANITTAKDTSAPTAPASPTLVVLPGFFRLKWTNSAEVDLRGGGYRIYIFTSNTPASAVAIRNVGYFTDHVEIHVGEVAGAITIAAGTEYYFWITAIDDSANECAKSAFTPASGTLPSTPVTIRKNSGANVGTRGRVNLIEGANITLTVADDAGDAEVDVTIAAGATTVYHTIVFCIPGNQVTGAAKAPSIIMPYTATIVKAYAYARTAPVGADLIFDINKNGTSIWDATQANRVKVADGATTGTQTNFDTTNLAENDRLDIDVDQIGGVGTVGADVTVELKVSV